MSSSCLSNTACSPSRVESSSVILNNISTMVSLEVRAKFQQLLQLLGTLMSSSATASNIKTGIVQSNIEKSVVLMNDPAHGCTHRRTSNIVPTDIHRQSMVHCIHGYPWTVHGTLYPRISMDCPWYIVSTDIHGLSMVHCIHGISMDCPWYIVSADIHGLSMVHCIRGYPCSTRTTYPRISMDCTTHPMVEMAGKVTREYNVPMDIHGLSAHPMGEMAGKVTQEYNVSMDIHGLSAHPMGEMAYSGIQCIHGYAWTVRAPHGGRWLEKLLGNTTLYPWISMDCPRTPWGRWLEKLLGIHGYPWTVRAPHGEMAGKVTREYNVSMDIHGLSAHPMGEMAGKVTRE